MEETMSIIFFLFSIIGSILVIGAIVYIIITMIKNNDEKKTKFKLSPKILLQIYLYVISFLTLAIAVIGISLAIKAGTSYFFDLPFSYTLQKANTYNENSVEFESTPKGDIPIDFEECYNGKKIQEYGKDFCFDSSQRKSDLITGISLFISMTLLFVIHQYAISKIKLENSILWLKKLYTFLSLILYSIAGLIVIPTSIYLVTNYFLFEIAEDTYSTPPAPAMALAFMIFIIPLWVYFLKKTTQLKEE